MPVKVPGPLQSASRALFTQLSRRRDGTTLPLQAAALPWRLDPEGQAEVLLVTSRRSGRWIIPKGQPMLGKSLAQAAAIEAYEEAGVVGRVSEDPAGTFEHLKVHWLMGPIRYLVVVHLLAVDRVLAEWPEQAERRRRWASPREAAKLVSSEELSTILRNLDAEKQRRVST